MASISKIKTIDGTTYDINAVTVNGHSVNSDIPANAALTDTTYTFAGGENEITVTPSGGSAQKVTITPKISGLTWGDLAGISASGS